MMQQVAGFLRTIVTFGILVQIATLGCARPGVAADATGSLRIVSSDLNAAPYIITDGVTFVGGIVKDLNDEAATRANVKVSYTLFSRKSIDAVLLSGEGHVTCNIQPGWTKIADQLVWTDPMFADSDVFWRRNEPQSPDIGVNADLSGKSFATFQGYHHHADLMAQVADGKTKRVDLYPSQNIFDALLNRRIDYVVFSAIRGEYLLKDKRYTGLIARTSLTDSTYSNFCAISKSAPIDIERYRATLNQIARDGTLDRILARYR